MAKGIEDTAFYRYFPLVSLNEVGGHPAGAVATVEEFHNQNLARLAKWPQSLIATTTHDTKRSEDVRARINVLSEIPHLWRKAVNRWARLNRRHRREVNGQPAPSRNDEYLFYQSLIGIWPLAEPDAEALAQLTERMQVYMEKATREAKLQTSWINPVPEYDAAVREFVAAALSGRAKNRFLAEFRRFHKQIVNWGLYTALAQTLLKLTSPGVPDIYQGQELWDFSLVDPDNRRPVDFALRRELLDHLQKYNSADAPSLLALARALPKIPAIPCSNSSSRGGFSSSAVNMPTFSSRENTSPWKSRARGRCTSRIRKGIYAAIGCAAADSHRDRPSFGRQTNAASGKFPASPAASRPGRLGRHADRSRRPGINTPEKPVHRPGLLSPGFAHPDGQRFFRFPCGFADKGAITQAQATGIVREFKYRFYMSFFSFCLAATRRGACKEGVKKAPEIHSLMKINRSAQIHPLPYQPHLHALR